VDSCRDHVVDVAGYQRLLELQQRIYVFWSMQSEEAGLDHGAVLWVIDTYHLGVVSEGLDARHLVWRPGPAGGGTSDMSDLLATVSVDVDGVHAHDVEYRASLAELV